MIIKIEDITGNTVRDIIEELENNADVMDIIRGQNLRGGDALEAMASDLFETGEDIDTNDYLHIN
jgi:hypothetical protein